MNTGLYSLVTPSNFKQTSIHDVLKSLGNKTKIILVPIPENKSLAIYANKYLL